MKRMLSLLMTVMLLLAITGCGAASTGEGVRIMDSRGLRLSLTLYPGQSYP